MYMENVPVLYTLTSYSFYFTISYNKFSNIYCQVNSYILLTFLVDGRKYRHLFVYVSIADHTQTGLIDFSLYYIDYIWVGPLA